MIELRNYQQEAIAAVRSHFRLGRKAPLLVMPTGAGKTICFCYMAGEAARRGLRVGILAHRRELISQISSALNAWDIPHGRVWPRETGNSEPVQVAMVPTLARRIALARGGAFRFDLLIIDEAHHATQLSTWGKVIAHSIGAKLLGVTATPERLDGRGLGVTADGVFDCLVEGPSVAALIQQGHLAQPLVYAPSQGPDLAGVRKRGGDFVAAQLAAAVDRGALTGDAVAHYRRLAEGMPAIAFAVTVAHAEHVAEAFRQGGYTATCLSGSTPDKRRAEILRDLAEGRLNVLASCDVISEGTDVPVVGAAILLRPTASYALCMQQIGRALRMHPGKRSAVILDHAGNVPRHGLPTDPVQWSLEGRAKPDSPPAMKTCFDCRALVAASCRVCPGCGRALPLQESARGELPTIRAGELVAFRQSRRADIWAADAEFMRFRKGMARPPARSAT